MDGQYFTNTKLPVHFPDDTAYARSSDESIASVTDDQEIILIDEGPAEVSFFDDNDNELLVLSFTVNHYETYDNETIDTETSGTIEQSNASTWISSSPDIIEVDDEVHSML